MAQAISQDMNRKFDAVIFDLDGVITKTALVHAAAWKEMFDEFLQKVSRNENIPFKAFTHKKDYLPFVDGKPRYEGVKSFLESRGIALPFGSPDDSAEAETVCGLGNRKNIKFREVLEKKGIEVYEQTVRLIKELKDNFIHVGVASSSKNCRFVLQRAGLEQYFETRVDGVVSAQLGLKGKPNGDIFVKAAENMGAIPARSIVVEDAVSGVQAGVNGHFGLVIGLARESNIQELVQGGADRVVEDFKGIGIKTLEQWFVEKNNSK